MYRRVEDFKLGRRSDEIMSNNIDLESLRSVFERSAGRHPFPDRESVEAAYRNVWPFGLLENHIHDRLRVLLVTNETTGIDTHDLRVTEEAFECLAAISNDRGPSAELNAILSGLPAGTQLRPITKEFWDEAADLGRALVRLKTYQSPNARISSVAQAAKRLASRGYRLTADLSDSPAKT
jgi:hypothetical protein